MGAFIGLFERDFAGHQEINLVRWFAAAKQNGAVVSVNGSEQLGQRVTLFVP